MKRHVPAVPPATAVPPYGAGPSRPPRRHARDGQLDNRHGHIAPDDTLTQIESLGSVPGGVLVLSRQPLLSTYRLLTTFLPEMPDSHGHRVRQVGGCPGRDQPRAVGQDTDPAIQLLQAGVRHWETSSAFSPSTESQ